MDVRAMAKEGHKASEKPRRLPPSERALPALTSLLNAGRLEQMEGWIEGGTFSLTNAFCQDNGVLNRTAINVHLCSSHRSNPA
eukprot:9475817-Pyramimonas_sp.AAC.1